jgi:glyoxylate/hydroxypyruvate reductase A
LQLIAVRDKKWNQTVSQRRTQGSSDMRIVLFVHPSGGQSKRDEWYVQLRSCIPQAEVELWSESSSANQCDYAVVWKASEEVISALSQQGSIKAVFNLGAGVDTVLAQGGCALAERVPFVRIDDGGIKEQMADYVTAAVLRYYRNMHVYAAQQCSCSWKPIPPVTKASFPVGIMGYGVLSRF